MIVALKIFAKRRISALPIVDENGMHLFAVFADDLLSFLYATGVVVDIYAKFDVIVSTMFVV